MSILVGCLSVATAYFWWTHDWWHPQTLFGTRVGLEDFLVGFASGGVAAVIYEVVRFKKLVRHARTPHHVSGFSILVVLAIISWLFWGLGFHSFWAAVIAMCATASLMYVYRPDLIMNGVMSGAFLTLASLPFYLTIIVVAPGWIEATYDPSLSGVAPLGIPIEEYVFWFLAGLVFGPFYEYWRGERLRKIYARVRI